MNDILDILRWSVARFLSPDEPPRLIARYGGECGSFCADVISGLVQSRGRGWLIPANLTLFTLGLVALFADDYVLAHTLSLSIRLIGIALACFFLILKFDAWRMRDARSLLKLLYIICTGIGGAYITLTYFFLMIYENIIAYRVWGGM